MPDWLKLYDLNVKVPITVRSDAITVFRADPREEGTLVWVGGTSFYVRETADQIRRLLGA